jgi:chaperonin GroES
MDNLKPLSDNVFIETIEDEKTTQSGIVIPDTADKERPMKGKIVAAGPGKRNEKGELIPMSVKVGDMVLFRKYGPDEIEVDGKSYLVAQVGDILAVIEK